MYSGNGGGNIGESGTLRPPVPMELVYLPIYLPIYLAGFDK